MHKARRNSTGKRCLCVLAAHGHETKRLDGMIFGVVNRFSSRDDMRRKWTLIAWQPLSVRLQAYCIAHRPTHETAAPAALHAVACCCIRSRSGRTRRPVHMGEVPRALSMDLRVVQSGVENNIVPDGIPHGILRCMVFQAHRADNGGLCMCVIPFCMRERTVRGTTADGNEGEQRRRTTFASCPIPRSSPTSSGQTSFLTQTAVFLHFVWALQALSVERQG
jgi:hypothetical protein